jgi:hypothetical protein
MFYKMNTAHLCLLKLEPQIKPRYLVSLQQLRNIIF